MRRTLGSEWVGTGSGGFTRNFRGEGVPRNVAAPAGLPGGSSPCAGGSGGPC